MFASCGQIELFDKNTIMLVAVRILIQGKYDL